MSKLWSGRFAKDTAAIVDEFNASIGFDARLWEYDIDGSIAHASMLGKCGIIPAADADTIVRGLRELKQDIEAGKVEFDVSAEDIHMNVEKLLHDRIGEVAGELQTARSRNDQVATDLRMYVRAQIASIDFSAKALQAALVRQAEQHIDTVMPGYTHLQHAQPVSLAHHLLAYVWMLQRDRERFADCRRRADVLPLGSAALAGTSFPIDREYVAKMLGFSRVSENSIDAVSDRDFAVEFLAAAATLGMHLSRLAEEIVLWNSREFGFVELDDSMATGSSLMPQKKNPDVAELIRAKSGRLYGDLLALLTVLKGLPLAYNKDLQEDKEPLFDSVDTVLKCLAVARDLIETTRFNAERMAGAVQNDFSNATDLADHLVRQGVPFRKAHEIVGRLVKYCLDSGKSLGELDTDELRRFSDKLHRRDVAAGPGASVGARNITGGTAPAEVRKQLEAATKMIR